MKKVAGILAIAFMVAVLAPQAVFAEDSKGDDMVSKLTRGVINLGFCWVEIPAGLRDNGASGLVSGTVNTVKRAVVGAIEIVTFPFPVPNDDYGPLMEPESPFDVW